MLYPQAIASVVPANDSRLLGLWRYTGANYALKGAPQMAAIMAEVGRITGR